MQARHCSGTQSSVLNNPQDWSFDIQKAVTVASQGKPRATFDLKLGGKANAWGKDVQLGKKN